MGSIPLPALGIKPVEQPDLMANYGRLMQLRGLQQEMQQRAAMAPYQLQAAQQAAQAGQMENQQRAIQLKDQQAMTSAMQQWDGKSIDELPTLVLKNGGSAQAVMGLKQQSLAMKEKYSQIAAQDATTGSKNIETMQKRNDMVSGALSTVLQAPDEQLPQAIVSTAQDLAKQGLLDPQHLQMAQQIAQSGNPQAMRAQLDTMRKGMLSDSQLLEDAQKRQDISAKKAQADWYAQNGGAPGVSAELVQQADWLKKNHGKGPSDYKLWVMQHSPQALVMGNQLSPDAVSLAAQNLLQTGQAPQGMYRSPGTTAAVYNEAAKMNTQQGGPGMAANKATFKANETSLANLQKNFDNVTAFENTAGKNLDQFLSTAKAVVDSGSPLINSPIRKLSDAAIGSDKMAAFNAARTTALTEIAKVLNSSNANGVLSDSGRNEVSQLIGPNATLKQIYRAAQVLRQDMANRHDAYQQQISDIQQRIGGGGAAGSPQSSNDVFSQFGGKKH